MAPTAERKSRRRRNGFLPVIASALVLSSIAFTAQAAPADNQYEVVGETGVSAMQIILSNDGTKMYIIDKVENNPLQVNGHPAWATEYDLATNKYRAMDVTTNSFCAGGNVLGNGTFINVGGNQPIGPGGVNANALAAPYRDGDGGKAIRLLTPCADQSCNWVDMQIMTTRRWYPTLETLEDGSAIIVGGCDFGGYVNDASQNNPTYEFFPSRGAPVGLNILTTTLPANLFPFLFLLPSGNIFVQSNLGAEIFDYKNNVEYPIANIPHAVRVYPASGPTTMLPLTPANNWTATLLFCGGTNLQPDQWVVTWNIAAYPADDTCVSISPDVSTQWVEEEPLPEGRSMGQFVFLPDGRMWMGNGIGTGTAGYGNTSWAIGQAFGTNPIYAASYYDPSAPKGKRFSRPASMGKATVPRLYHSTAMLIPDGSIWIAGSNPNADYIAANTPGYPWVTEYRVEKFYPDYFTKTRPQPTGLPTTLGYGGNYFEVKLSAADVGAASNIANTKVVLIRGGFSTHAMQMGQRYVQLNHTYTYNKDGSAVLHVSQLPPNPAILVPGPALMFVVVNGIPSIGTPVMIGNGQIGAQAIAAVQDLPVTVGAVSGTSSAAGSSATGSGSGTSSGSSSNTNGSKKSGAPATRAFGVAQGRLGAAVVAVGVVAALAFAM